MMIDPGTDFGHLRWPVAGLAELASSPARDAPTNEISNPSHYSAAGVKLWAWHGGLWDF